MKIDKYYLNSEENKISSALQVFHDKQNPFIQVGDIKVPVPTLQSRESELDGFNKFLAQTQLGSIERNKQRRIRETIADAELNVLRIRTEAVVASHNGLTKAALEEILVAAREYALSVIRDAELREQTALQRAVVRASIQYRDFLAQLPSDLPAGVLETVQSTAQEIFENTLLKIKTASFDVRIESNDNY